MRSSDSQTGRLLLPPGVDYYDNLEQACGGGVTIVQLREKNISTKQFIELAQRSKEITDRVSRLSWPAGEADEAPE